MSNKYLKGNIYLVTLFRILVLFLLYAVCRLVFYIFNHSYFTDLSFTELAKIFGGGLIFDASAIVYTNALYLFLMLIPFKFRHNKKYLGVLSVIFIVINSVALLSNIADTAYYEFVLRRTGADIFSQFSNEENLLKLTARLLIEYWYLSLFSLIMVAILIILYRKFTISGPQIKSSLIYYGTAIIIFAAGIILVIGGARGGFRQYLQPVKMNDAWAYVKDPEDAALVLNTPFTFIQSIGKYGYERPEYFRDENELESIYTPVHKTSPRLPKKDNIVIIIIESLNKELIGAFNKNLDKGTYKGYTPFLDSLISVSRVYTHSYANGRKSIDVLPSVFCSIPHVETPFVLMTPYYTNNLTSLPQSLKQMGYKTALFHGAPNGSFGLESFSHILGVDEYYGMDEYNNDNDYDGSWGIWDEEFFQFFARTIDTFPDPFMAALFSLSSHHPFKVPERYENMFSGCTHPLQKCVQYSDYSLKGFFRTVSGMDWYKNTLFIITADHVSKNQRPEYQNECGSFSIPIIFYHPGRDLSGTDSVINAQQIDIMPTVLNYVGFNKDYISFGKDLFGKTNHNFAFNYLNNTYRLFLDDYLLVSSGSETLSMYKIQNGHQLNTDLKDVLPARRDSMETFLKAFIQQYKNRMIDNRLAL